MGQPRKRRITTHNALEALKPGKDDVEWVVDSGVRGQGTLVVRNLPTGKSFFYRYKLDGRRRFELIGYFDSMGQSRWDRTHKGGRLTLAAAKAAFLDLAQLANSEGDLAVYFDRQERLARDARLVAEREARLGTFQDLLNVYVMHLETTGKVSAREAEATFARNVQRPFPNLAKSLARDVRKNDIQTILAKMIERGVTRHVNITRSYLRAAFRHASRRDNDPRRLAENGVVFDLQQNPVELIERIAEYDTIGTRVLSGDEIRAYWLLLDTVESPITRTLLKIHLLTGGQRPKQLIAAPWSSYDMENGLVTLIDAKGKGTAREHVVPLPAMAVALLEELKERTGKHVHPFQTQKKGPLRLETAAAAVAEITRAAAEDGTPLFNTPFTLRDVRRTVETRLADMGVVKEVRSQLLSHGRGDKIDLIYNRSQYLPQKRAALRAWTDFLKITPSTESATVPLREIA